MQKQDCTYLALGDSYTIGEGVPLHDNFPYQTARLLDNEGYSISQPAIVAKTGWTTKDLLAATEDIPPGKNNYDIVSLLIGVNNQYRGEDPQEYEKEFEELIQRAIAFASEESTHVFVLSIPDWGVTPYAQGRDRGKIFKEIESFNVINKRISEKWGVNYIDVTSGGRDAASDHSLIAADGLHPSAKEYNLWARKLASAIQQQPK